MRAITPSRACSPGLGPRRKPKPRKQAKRNQNNRHGAAARVLGFCQWLERTPGSIALHESIWGYPIIESVHVLTLCLFLGLAVMLDLRLLGLTMRKLPVSVAIERLVPWTIAGFVIMVISGSLLFFAIPVKTYLNIFFRLKVVF